MAVRINFDGTHNVIQPTLVLSTRSGRKIGAIPAHKIVFNNSLNEGSQISFALDMSDCSDTDIWRLTTDFKLVWVREWDRYFEISVSVDENNGRLKNVTGTSLGEAELSQINLYSVEINTENDIAFDDYKPSVFYNVEDKKHSILHRITADVPHYSIRHVDNSLTTIQRTFSFNEKSILDAMREISEEIHCLFVFDCHTESGAGIVRDINVYDLESYCPECGKRGEFSTECTYCGNTNVIKGYGKDTPIFVSTDNLADTIQDTTDIGSVKNCFKLEAGDDLMTATIAACDPSGTGYIWSISDETKEDMSEALRAKINEYDEQYRNYHESYNAFIPDDVLAAYNTLVQKYSNSNNAISKIESPIVGYSNLMNVYFDTIDFYLYLNNAMMPTASMQNTNATEQASLLMEYISHTAIAVKNVDSVTKSSVDSSALSLAKAAVDPRYQVKISESSFSGVTWRGKFKLTNYANDDDTTETIEISRTITGDYAEFIRQALKKAASKHVTIDNPTDISGLFDLEDDVFSAELNKYSLVRLNAFRDACQSCVDLMIQNGIADADGAAEQQNGLYTNAYIPYYSKLGMIESEIKERESEIEIITGKKDEYGNTSIAGIQTILDSERGSIRNNLDFERFIGSDLMTELAAYRRDDVYKNDNYISDGLDNAELFKLALQFIEIARNEISRASTIQHSFSATLGNLLAIKEFEPIVENFEVGNWIRLRSDDNIYRLRLIQYQIDFEDFDRISVSFSDAKLSSSGYSDIEDIINNAASMSTTFNAVTRQAKKGSDSNSAIAGWVENGLSMTQIKIVGDADNQNVSWDSHGILCREYEPEFDRYDPRQTKIINRGIYVTDDNWRTSKVGVGDFVFYNPKTKQFEESYGVIADTLVGSMVLSEEVGIYNLSGSVTIDGNGLTITADTTMTDEPIPEFTIQKKYIDDSGVEGELKQLYIDSDGELVINADVRISSSSSVNNTIGGVVDAVNSVGLDIEASKTSVIATCESIILNASADYVKQGELESFESSIESQLAIMSDSILLNFNSTTNEIQRIDGDVSNRFEDLSKHIKFSGETAISIGTNDDGITLELDNDTGIAFKRNGYTFGRWDGTDFHTGNVIIDVNERAQFGNFAFVPRSDHSLMFLKVGDDQGSITSLPNIPQQHQHDYTAKSIVEPTCVNDGYTLNSCVCGDSYRSDQTYATGHDYTEEVTPPTCTESGYTDYVCKNCGESYRGNATNPLGHNYISKVVRPTTTAQGYTTHTCSRCGDSYVDSYTDKVKCYTVNVDRINGYEAFRVNDSGYYESETLNKQLNSGARIAINTSQPVTLNLHVISYNYDIDNYAVIGELDNSSISTWNGQEVCSFHTGRGSGINTPGEKVITFEIPKGNHFIDAYYYVYYTNYGDSSYTNSLQFRIEVIQ